jgi:hypothetical protein
MTKLPESEAAEQEVPVDTKAQVTSPEGWFSQFLQISRAIINCGDFDFQCAGVHDDDSAGCGLHPLARGLPLSQMMMNRSFSALNMQGYLVCSNVFRV